MPRYVPPQVWNALTSENAGTVHELFEFDVTSGTKYYSFEKYTWRGQVYTPLIQKRSDLKQSITNPSTDSVTVDLINIDGTIRSLLTNDEFLDAPARMRIIVDGLANSTAAVYTGTATGKTCTVVSGYPKPQQRDGLWSFLYVHASTNWTAIFERADGYKSASVTFGSSTGGTFTSSDGFMSVTITGTYNASDNLKVWSLRTTNNFLVFAGICENPVDASERGVEVTIRGMCEKLMAPVPKRNFRRECPWVFKPVATSLALMTPCGYVGPTSTANGAGVSSTALTVNSGTDFVSAKNRLIKIGSNSAVKITAVSGTSITIETAQSWSNGDNVTFQDCRKTFRDCQDANQESNYGGFLGIRTTKEATQRQAYVKHDNAGAHGNHWNWAGILSGPIAGPPLLGLESSGSQVPNEIIRPVRASLPVPLTDDPLPIVYGWRTVKGEPVELFSFDDNAGRPWRSIFYVLSGGTIDSADASWIAGKRRKQKIETISGKQVLWHGFWYRTGGAGTNDSETNAEYDTDSTTLLRAQNIDYQGGTGTTYPQTAYAITRFDRGADVWGGRGAEASIPDGFFRIKGKKVSTYTRAGVAASAAFSQNPMWQCVDLMTDVIDGAALPLSAVAYTRTLAAATYADVSIDSVEADTLSTATATSDTQDVKSTAGFKLGETVYKNGVSLSATVADVISATRLKLSGSVTITNGDRVSQKNARFQSDIKIEKRNSCIKAMAEILAGCRGYVVQQDGEIAVDIDRDFPAEQLTDGGVETWTSATNLTNWTETLAAGATINREATTIHGGTYSCRIDQATTTGTYITSANMTLDANGVYTLHFWARGNVAGSVGVRIIAGSNYLQSDGTWSTTNFQHKFTLAAADTWESHFFMFRVDPHNSVPTGTVTLAIGTYDDTSFNSKSLYLDDISIMGPGVLEFRDLGRALLKQRAFIVEGEGSFKQGPAYAQRDVNEVKVSFTGSLGAIAYPPNDDGITLKDETHQATHIKKEYSITAASLSTPDQAVRIAKWAMGRARTLKEGARCIGFLASLIAMPGDVVYITHRSPAWTRRLHRVLETQVQDDLRTELSLEHYVSTVYTDLGEPSELGLSAGLPTITLSLDQMKRRRMDISWIPSASGEPIDRYDIFIGDTTLDSADPSTRYHVGHTKQNYYRYHIPEAQAGTTLYARVVGILHNGEFAVSNEVSAAGDDAQLVAVDHSWNKDGDFTNAGTNWNAAAHGATCNFTTGCVDLNATGHAGALFPTVYQAWPKGIGNNKKPVPDGATISFAISAKYTGAAPTAPLRIIIFSGSEVGDDSETNFTEIGSVAAGDIGSTFSRFYFHYTFAPGSPATPGGGTKYNFGFRTASTNTIRIDKAQSLIGMLPLTGWVYRQHVEDETAGEYGDYNAGSAGGGPTGGGSFTPGGTKKYSDPV